VAETSVAVERLVEHRGTTRATEEEAEFPGVGDGGVEHGASSAGGQDALEEVFLARVQATADAVLVDGTAVAG